MAERTRRRPARTRYLPSTAAGAEERLGNEQLKELFREKLAEFAKTLEGKERFIFENRLIADEPLTLQDIGDKYGRQPRAGPADRSGADQPDARVHARADSGLRPGGRAQGVTLTSVTKAHRVPEVQVQGRGRRARPEVMQGAKKEAEEHWRGTGWALFLRTERRASVLTREE